MGKLPVYIKTQVYKTSTTDFYYPLVYGLLNLDVQRKINNKIYRLMHQIINDLSQPDIITYINGFYEIKTNERNVLSLTLNAMGDFHGAHPMTIIKSLTFDVKTGKVYEFKDLFKENSNYLEEISNVIAKEIEERDIPLLGEFKGVTENQDYYIADKNIIIYFQLYEISPYYAGFPYFSIPIYKLETFIDNGILKRMLYWL